MTFSTRHPVLRTKVGDNGFLELVEMLEIVTDRFERRLTEEIAAVREDIAAGRLSMIRWMFGFFVAYLGVTLSLAGLILHAAN